MIVLTIILVTVIVALSIGCYNLIRQNEALEESALFYQTKLDEIRDKALRTEIELKELVAFTEELRNEYFIKFINVPLEFEPLTMPMCEDLAEWYESQPKDIDD